MKGFPPGASVRVYSKVLEREVWIAPDEIAVNQLIEQKEIVPILRTEEAMMLGGLPQNIARELMDELVKVQAVFPGSRLRKVKLK